jgi:hypothetical protein
MIRKRGKILLACLATASAVLLWPASSASASDGAKGGGHVVPFFAHFEDDGSTVPSSIPCPNGQAVKGEADFGLKQGDTWHGHSVFDICVVPTSTPGTFTFSGVEKFTGTVDGCGTGSITYDVSNGFIQPVANATAPNGFQAVTIRPGASTGGLSRVSRGQGVSIFTMQDTFANEGFYAGSLTC